MPSHSSDLELKMHQRRISEEEAFTAEKAPRRSAKSSSSEDAWVKMPLTQSKASAGKHTLCKTIDLPDLYGDCANFFEYGNIVARVDGQCYSLCDQDMSGCDLAAPPITLMTTETKYTSPDGSKRYYFTAKGKSTDCADVCTSDGEPESYLSTTQSEPESDSTTQSCFCNTDNLTPWVPGSTFHTFQAGSKEPKKYRLLS